MININKRDYQLLLEKKGRRINQSIKKVNKGYPIQYLIGNVNFFGYEILVNKSVLIPRFETEQLVEETIKIFPKKESLKILDLGTGSGCIAITLKKTINNSEVTAIDKSLRALLVAKKNAKLNNAPIKFIWQDIKKVVPSKFDLIISNPPYISKDEEIMPAVKKYEPKVALFAKNNGLHFYHLILNKYKNSLTNNGVIALEIGATQKNAILEIVKEVMPRAKTICKKDYAGKDRFIFIINNV